MNPAERPSQGIPSGYSSASVKAMTCEPAATATYCLPSTKYVIGEAFQVTLA